MMSRRLPLAVWMVSLVASAGCAGPAFPASSGRAVSEPAAASVGPAASQSADDALSIADRIQAGDGVTVCRLSNGLVVIVQPTRIAPVVCVKAYVRAGSLYERGWWGAGISHLLEHLVADDADHDGEGQAAAKSGKTEGNRVTAIGGQSNAYTSMGETCYYISAAAGKADDCIDLVADWMARPKFTQADFNREHGVVQREVEKGLDDPERQAWASHMRLAYGTHPAAIPVIGFSPVLRRITWDNVLAYHRKMYIPQNTVFVVVGDVDVEKVLQRTLVAFAGWPAGREPDLSLPEAEPVVSVRRNVVQNGELTEAIEAMSFQTVPLSHEDLYALDVLDYVLGQGPSSRLSMELFRRRKLVSGVETSSWTPAWGKGLFTINFRCQADQAERAERAILEQLAKVAAEPVIADELEIAKRQKLADLVESQQTADSRAGTLATDWLSAGDVAFSKLYTERINGVTAGQVQAAAKKYFRPGAMIVTRAVPAVKEAATTQPASEPQAKARVLTLDNGLKVILQPASCGLASMAYAIDGGLLSEDAKTNGLGVLMMAMSTRGTKDYTAEQIDAFFDRAGGGIKGVSGSNSFCWQATVLKDSFDEAMKIFAGSINSPAFDAGELEILRPAAIARIRKANEDWFAQLMNFTRRDFFAGAPYALSSQGDETVVAKATVEQIREHYARTVASAGPRVLTVFGDFDPDAAEKLVRQCFTSRPGQAQPPRQAAAARKVPPEGRRSVLKTDKQQACIMLAVPSITLRDLDERFALDVLDTIMSGYQLPSGWLHEELRGKQLVYVVHAFDWIGVDPGAFFAYAACQPENAQQVQDIMTANFHKAAGYTPSREEVDRAVNVILTAELLDNQSAADLALPAALDELYGLGWDFHRRLEGYYRKVTPKDVQRVGAKYFSGAPAVFVTTPRPDLLKPPAGAAATQPVTK